MATTITNTSRRHRSGPFLTKDHKWLLGMFMLIVVFHFAEHILQIIQIVFLGYPRSEAGGLLGEQFPALLTSETLHFGYNLLLFIGLVMLYRGMSEGAKTWWLAATILQGWHFFEHAILQFQWITGWYWFGKARQTSVLENFIPRIELHFMYNLIVTIPILIALGVHLYQRVRANDA